MVTANNQVWIYTPVITTRVSYICSVLFDGQHKLVSSPEELTEYNGARINYSDQKIESAIQVIPFGLLQETDIRKQTEDCFDWEGMTCIFKTAGDIPFDIFSASFYLLSRYEEYLPYEKDRYGRYAHTNSLAYREGFLNIPLVNIWLRYFRKVVCGRFRDMVFADTVFRFIPTYDIDIAYAYRHQPVWKNVFGFFRDLAQGKTDRIIERGNVYSGQKNDPFDTFSWLDRLHTKYGLQPIYFCLTIIKRGEYDKNLKAASKALQKLYRVLSAKYPIGLHPSWQSGTDESLLLQEKQKLESIIGHSLTVSRNHYLRFMLPHGYRRLIEAGFTEDHSMAYGSINGFRASYALPYYWYDLEREEATKLVVHPFCFMEASSAFEQGYSAEQAAEEIQYYYDIVRSVNGEFVILFHNHFLTEQPEWVEWREMYEGFLKKNFGFNQAE